MPEICRFWLRMFSEYTLPHIHVEYQGNKAVLDFYGNCVPKGDLKSRTALMVRDWIDLRVDDLHADSRLAPGREVNKIAPLD